MPPPFSLKTQLPTIGLAVGGTFLLYLTAAWLSVKYPSAFDGKRFYRAMQRWPREGEPVLLSRFATWDGAHYLYLSEVGHRKGRPSCAFYPLWPMLMRLVERWVKANHVIVGLILANLFTFAAFAIFMLIVGERFQPRTARWALAYLAMFPGALFFHFTYSEGIFLFLVMLAVLGLQRRRYGLVWAATFLLPLTRAIGIFCLFPLVWHLVSLRRTGLGRSPPGQAGGPSLQAAGGLALDRPWRHARVGPWMPPAFLDRTVLLLLAPVLGYSTYFFLMWHWTGNPFEGFEAQRYWAAHSIGNIFNMPKLISAFFNPSSWHQFQGSLLDRCMFLLLVYCLPVIWKLDKGWVIWALVLGVVPASSGDLVSYTRYGSVVFPVFIALAVVLTDKRLWWARWGLMAVFAVLQTILVWRL